MDRGTRKGRAASFSAPQGGKPSQRGLGKRVGLQKKGGSVPAAPRPAKPAPAPGHRVTKTERLRQRRRRALLGFLLVAAVTVLGVVLSVNLLFKVHEFRIEALDGTTPADTGIYTEQEILDLLAVPAGSSLLGFSTAEKSQLLAAQLPYLEQVQVNIRLPGTVVVKVSPAVERFALQVANGWLVLSGQRKVLRVADELPQGVIALDALTPADTPTVAGQYVTLLSHNTLLDAPQEGTDAAPTPDADPDADAENANAVLEQLMTALEQYAVLDGVTALSIADLSELTFTYQDRVLVRLGTANNLDDKLHVAAGALLPSNEKSLGATDRGTLEFFQRTNGELLAYFEPGDPNAPPEDPVTDGIMPEDPVTDGDPTDGTTGDGDDGKVVG